MSQQINLYDPSLRRQRDLPSALHVVVAAGVVLLVLGAWGAWTRVQVLKLEGEAEGIEARLKGLRDQSTALGSELASRKPDARLEGEVAAGRTEIENRKTVLAVLRKGLGPDATSFAEYLRGLARQSSTGLWLSGFSVDAETNAMEIRGRTLDPSSLPDYIRRLNGEKAFQGRSFAALQMKAALPEPVVAPGSAAPAAAAAATPSSPVYQEFVLVPAKPAPAPAEKRS